MSFGLASSLRRFILLTLLATLSGAAFRYLRERSASSSPSAPEWPPFEPRIVPPEPRPAGSTADSTAGAAAAGSATWVGSAGGGVVPDDYPVKVKVGSGIFHVPGGRFYDRTVADRHYVSAEAAEADGYRRSKT